MKYLIKNVQLVDVVADRIYPADVLMADGCFSMIIEHGKEEGIDVCSLCQDTKVVDAEGSYALPGLIDAHTHVELSLLSSASFAEAVLACGTTAAVLDPHDAVNALGAKGAWYLMEEMKGTKLTPVWMASPCVPSAPGYEDCYKQIMLEDVKIMVEEYGMYGIAEAMDYDRVISGEESLAEILAYAGQKGLRVDGHAPCVVGADLDAYIKAGVMSDHESVTVEEMLEKYRKGMCVILRRGSLEEPAKAGDFLNQIPDTDRVLLSTDGCITAKDILEHGHMNYALAQVVREGVDPIRAVKMGTIYPAKNYGLDHMGSISEGKKADLVLVKNLETFEVQAVYVDGLPLEKNCCNMDFPEEVIRSLKRKPLTLEEMQIPVPDEADRIKANIVHIVDGTLETGKEQRILQVKEKQLCLDEDLLYCAVVDRYRENGSVGLGLVSGAGCFKGAFAGSIAQDTQNLIAIGDDPQKLLLALNYVIEKQGGIVLVQDDKTKNFIPLPVLGILTQDPIEKFSVDVDALNLSLREAGLTLMNPILTLSLQLPLAVIPEMAVTNRGLFDINKKQFIAVCEPVL